MALENLQKDQHVRFNPLKNEWILVSPQRVNRPWQGRIENKSDTKNVKTEGHKINPLAPGATRSMGKVNENYTSTYVFQNDYPALLPSNMGTLFNTDNNQDDLFKWGQATGECRVMCFSPDSNITLPLMSNCGIENVIMEWIKQVTELGIKYPWIQIFENKGELMGASNPHPHCQIWASSFVPNEGKVKDINQLSYYVAHDNKPLLLDYAEREVKKGERLIDENDSWITVVPFWAMWPFEAMILPKRHILRFQDLSDQEIKDLALIMKKLLIRYDNLFECSFPYSMGWHGAPTGSFYKENMNHWQFHGVYYPPLLRSAQIKKFMVGYELLAQPQRDITPEKVMFSSGI